MKIPWLSLKQPVQLGGLQMVFLLEGQPVFIADLPRHGSALRDRGSRLATGTRTGAHGARCTAETP